MAILTKPVSINKGADNIFTLNKTELAANTIVAANSYFSDQNNWGNIVVTYKTTEGSELENIFFDASLGTPTGIFNIALTSRDVWEVKSLVIYDHDGGRLTIKRSKLVSAEFDMNFQKVATTLQILGEPLGYAPFGYPLPQGTNVRVFDQFGDTMIEDVYARIVSDIQDNKLVRSGGNSAVVTSGANGQAHFNDLEFTADFGAGNYIEYYTLSGATVTSGINITVTNTPLAVSLAVTTQPPNPATVDQDLIPQPVVQILDQFGNALSQAGVAINVSTFSGGSDLSGTKQEVTASDGSVTFTALQFNAVSNTSLVFSGDIVDLGQAYSDYISSEIGIPAPELISGYSSVYKHSDYILPPDRLSVVGVSTFNTVAMTEIFLDNPISLVSGKWYLEYETVNTSPSRGSGTYFGGFFSNGNIFNVADTFATYSVAPNIFRKIDNDINRTFSNQSSSNRINFAVNTPDQYTPTNAYMPQTLGTYGGTVTVGILIDADNKRIGITSSGNSVSGSPVTVLDATNSYDYTQSVGSLGTTEMWLGWAVPVGSTYTLKPTPQYLPAGYTSVLEQPVAGPTLTPTTLTWDINNPSGATYTANSITATESGLTSGRSIPSFASGDVEIVFSVDLDIDLAYLVGFESNTPPVSMNGIGAAIAQYDFCVSNTSGYSNVYVNGAAFWSGAGVTSSDVLKLTIQNGVFYYYKNDVLQCSSTSTPVYPVHLGAAIQVNLNNIFTHNITGIAFSGE